MSWPLPADRTIWVGL